MPSIPHEKGYDSFFIHSLANSISNYGVANWWINWMSAFGLYPYSYASAVPFTLSGISQLTEIRMEISILLFCVFLGLFSIFASYSLATVIYNSFLQRFIFATAFSLSAGMINLTTWEITTRAQIIVFFPLLLYLVFQVIKVKLKFIPLYIITSILLLATHHFIYIMIFYSGLIIICSLIYKFNLRANLPQIQKTNLKKINLNYIYISTILLIIISIFLFGSKWGLISSGSRYAWIIDIIIITARNVGVMLPLAFGGLIYIIFKKNKLLEEWAILICLIPTLVFSFNQIYGYLTIYLFAILLAGTGFFNIIKNQKRSKTIIISTIIMFLILNVAFSAFFNHYRLGMSKGSSEWYMKEETYMTGEWIRDNVGWDKKAIANSIGEGNRLYASYGGQPALYLDDISNYANGFIILNESNIKNNSLFSQSYYFDGPYVLKSGTTSLGTYGWVSMFPLTSEHVQKFINNNNISYFFEDQYSSNPLFNSLHENKNAIYSSGRKRIWTS